VDAFFQGQFENQKHKNLNENQKHKNLNENQKHKNLNENQRYFYKFINLFFTTLHI